MSICTCTTYGCVCVILLFIFKFQCTLTLLGLLKYNCIVLYFKSTHTFNL
uniref:Uncharacterized protein n=1 Tax=Anguilla anguilla TaxID=7936 RepID=A0A0E9Q647_ANGAN